MRVSAGGYTGPGKDKASFWGGGDCVGGYIPEKAADNNIK
jgi:hypothetical protein